jgi:hypothetical protein
VEHGLSNIVVQTSSEDYADRLYWRFCDNQFDKLTDSRKSEFTAVIDNINLGAGSAAASVAERHNKFCGDYRTRTDRLSKNALFTSTLYDKVIDAWRSCIDATNRQLFIVPTIPTDQKYVNISLRFTGTGNKTDFQGVEATGMKCTSDGSQAGPDTRFDVTPTTRSIYCERTGTNTEIGGVASTYYPAAGVTVKTGAGSQSIEFVEMVDGPAKGRLEQLETKISGVEKRAEADLKNVQDNLKKYPPDPPQTKDVMSAENQRSSIVECPAGQYVSGIGVVDQDTGRYCTSCINGVTIQCRPLNP